MSEIDVIVTRVFKELPLGRYCTWNGPAVRMMELVKQAGHGDHLEIGVLHGATAIMAALTKEWLGLRGKVVCIDPLKGYYPASPLNPSGVVSERGQLLTKEIDEASKTPVTPEVFWENVRYFGMEHRIKLVQDFSYPWPKELEAAQFVSAYIDGDHYHEGPTKDWENVHPRIVPGGLVWFDDCNDNCPGVQKACTIAQSTPGWQFVQLYMGHTFIVQKEK